MDTLRWGIIGFGRFGAIHAETIQSMIGSELTALCTRTDDQLEQAIKHYPVKTGTTDYSDILRSPDIDVVTITTHWQQHFDIAKAALTSGKHVFLEKPMAATGDQCRELVRLAAASSGMFMVGHICRFDPRAGLAHEAISAGRIGRIVSMHARRNLPQAPGKLRLDKISPLMGDGVHDADLMIWFMGKTPSRVYGRTIAFGGYQYPDLGWAMLDFGTDAVGVVETVWCLPQKTPTVIDAQLQVIGTDGMLTVDCSNTGLTVIDDSGLKMSDTVYWPKQRGQRLGALNHELSYFADCIRKSTAPELVTPVDAARAVIVMEAAERSADSGQPYTFSKGELFD